MNYTQLPLNPKILILGRCEFYSCRKFFPHLKSVKIVYQMHLLSHSISTITYFAYKLFHIAHIGNFEHVEKI